ncbi:hypothetical protein M9H77_01776 [Catharanthus roseus]|uniref:Uncharacterized protein n=1 Tax=Catharanthus roseus TaxID=4058 RepID=A0ACC0C6W9_CATRO|nr:hypothetical protein M9H77_01776 [Catharanthus roseus]
MVWPGARRGDDDLGPVTDRTDRGRVVTESSRVPVDSSYSNGNYGAIDCGNPSSDAGLGRDSGISGMVTGPGLRSLTCFILVMSKIARSRQKRPKKLRSPTNPTQRKKAKNDGWEQIGPADGGPLGLVFIPSYSGHIASSILREQLIAVIHSDLRITDSSVGINGQDLAQVAKSPGSQLSTELRATCYVPVLLGSSLFTDKSGNNVPGKLWPLVKDVSSVGRFAWGLDILVFSYVCPSGETGSKVVQAVYPEICDVGTQKGAQINRHLHLFRLDDLRRGQVDCAQARGDN